MDQSQQTERPEPPARRRPRRPSLSTLIALVALVIALSTTANALPGRNTVEANDIKRGAVTPAKIKDHGVWAVVGSDGTLVQGRGVVSVTRDGPGIYFVDFDRGVVKRALTATVYNEGFGSGQVNVRHCSTAHPLGQLCTPGEAPNRILVNTEDAAGANADRHFVVVASPTSPGVTTATSERLAPRRGFEGR